MRLAAGIGWQIRLDLAACTIYDPRHADTDGARGMETTLHRQLKEVYCHDPDQHEVVLDGYRIDAIVDDRLIEIQQAGLGALRTKIATLLKSHDVIVVKPLVGRKVLIKRARKGGRVQSTRTSPKRETFFDLFDELVNFVTVFPHQRLSLHVLLTEQEEHRVVTGKRRRRDKGYRVEDRRLTGITDRLELRTCRDLQALLPADLPQPFSTADIAKHAGVPRWLAQKAAYCLRMTSTARLVGKDGNTLLYEWQQPTKRAA
ncbi:MAG: hypothetical protein KDA86_24620 [Planctomycetaceae bacterium]|nr:hypothetical protein [Planctomycetaceae bacterium]